MHGVRMLAGAAVLIHVLAALAAHPPPADAIAVCTNGSTRYTAGNAYETSLRRVAATLPSNASSSAALFAIAAIPAAGSNSNQTVYALGHCRGDLGAASCAACLRAGFKEARARCPNAMDVSVYYDDCHMRFSDLDFLASTNNSEQQAYFTGTVDSSVVGDLFNALLTQLLRATAEFAAAASSRLRFATGEMDVDDDSSKGRQQEISSIFSMAQCTPDLTPLQCRACLAGAMVEMSRRVLATNSTAASLCGERCGLRFAPFRFYDGDAMVHLHLAPPHAQGKTSAMTIVLAIVLPIFGGLLALAFIGLFGWINKRSRRKASLFINVDDMESLESIFIDLSTLQSATSNFDKKNKLGEGRFGVVYKGALPDGQEVAVKRLPESPKQGLSQMRNELALLVKLQHKNLVRIIGICLEKHEHLLVYKYMPNKSLDTIIFDPNKSGQLDWGARFKIINGIARGLQHVHEHSKMKIVHGDLKASNILLNADMKPKISDFGLAKIFKDDQTRHVASHIIATLGYMNPEYAICEQYSTKLDVFSFGVLVLEIVTGRRNNYAGKSEHSPDLFCLVWKHWVEGTIAQIVDHNLGRHYPIAEVLKCINISLLCVKQNPTDRPSMSAIVVMLDSDTVAAEAPYRPAYVNRSRSYLESTTKLVMEKEKLCSEPHSSITELVPR